VASAGGLERGLRGPVLSAGWNKGLGHTGVGQTIGGATVGQRGGRLRLAAAPRA